jgi:triosephosphate isomerase
MRTPVICGNWKMYKDPAGTTSFFESFWTLVERSENCEIVICPSFVNLERSGLRAELGYRLAHKIFVGRRRVPLPVKSRAR